MQYSKQKQTQRNIITVDEFRAITEDESTLQAQCEEYLEFLKYDFIRIPSSVYAILFGAKSKLTVFQKRFIAKYLKGLSDLTILRPLTDKYALAARIELKTAKGKLSQGQKNKHRKIPLIICRSFEHFGKEISEFEKFKIGENHEL